MTTLRVGAGGVLPPEADSAAVRRAGERTQIVIFHAAE